jgi:hypothetical protein
MIISKVGNLKNNKRLSKALKIKLSDRIFENIIIPPSKMMTDSEVKETKQSALDT